MYQGKCVLLSECIKLKFIPCQKIGKPFLQDCKLLYSIYLQN